MEILHVCPAGLATGGTEGIHHLVSELNTCGADAKILYVGESLEDPQPEAYKKKYHCPYITEFPKDYTGVIIFPEIMGNQVIESKYDNCLTAINWQGIDVYNWHTPSSQRGLFLKRKNTIHITMSEYGMDRLSKLGVRPIKVSDCINDAYMQEFNDTFVRSREVLYNPTPAKLTTFQQYVMDKCTAKFGIKFRPLQGYTQDQLIDIFRHSKLYIDFGVYSGRERLPREAVMCGCCILTSRNGTAGYYADNSIPDRYKLTNEDKAIGMIKYVLDNYEQCKSDFYEYQRLLREDMKNYHNEVMEVYNAFLNYYSSL